MIKNTETVPILGTWKCRSCHHEWEGYPQPCAWCGEPWSVLLEAGTALGRMFDAHTERRQ